MARNYLQGRFSPVYPDKYVGDVSNIIYRSSWEKKFMIWADNNRNIIRWCSEEIVVPYYDPTTNKNRRYFVDFMIEYINRSGETRKALIEVKPEYQTKPPVLKSKVTKRYITETFEYEKNKAKWSAAKEWCSLRGLEFVVLTEKHLGIKK